MWTVPPQRLRQLLAQPTFQWRPSAKLVVDVGGASGALISSLLMKNPALMGAILERPEVVPRAFAQRTEEAGGAFFEVLLRLDTVWIDAGGWVPGSGAMST